MVIRKHARPEDLIRLLCIFLSLPLDMKTRHARRTTRSCRPSLDTLPTELLMMIQKVRGVDILIAHIHTYRVSHIYLPKDSNQLYQLIGQGIADTL